MHSALTPAGNVGIGTTDPYYKLEIGDGTDDATYLQLTATNTGNSGFLFGDSDARAQGRVEYNHSNDYMRFRTDGTERMRIDSDGNVGIGTTNPAANHKLHIKNTETANFRLERNKAGHTNAQNGYLQITAAESSNLIYSKDLDGNGKDFVIDGGNVGIGTTNPGSYKLNVNGTAYFNDTITVVATNYTSDDRVKHNEQPIIGALETLSKITPKKYIKTTEMYDANHDFELDESGNPIDENGEPVEHRVEAGVIAQQVLTVDELAFAVSPEGVDQDGAVTSPHGLDYNSLFTYAIAAIQEQQQLIEQLKSQNESLATRISALES